MSLFCLLVVFLFVLLLQTRDFSNFTEKIRQFCFFGLSLPAKKNAHTHRESIDERGENALSDSRGSTKSGSFLSF